MDKQLDLFEEAEKKELLEDIKKISEEKEIDLSEKIEPFDDEEKEKEIEFYKKQMEYFNDNSMLPPEIVRRNHWINSIDSFGRDLFYKYMEENETDMRDSVYYEYERYDYICVCSMRLAIMMIQKIDRNHQPDYFSNSYDISTSVNLSYVIIHCPVCGEGIKIASSPGYEIVKTLGVVAEK